MKPFYIYFIIICCLSCSQQGEQRIKVTDNSHYNRAYEFLEKRLDDSAFLEFSRAKDLFIEANDSINTANCLINMAITQKDQGDYFGAQESGLQSINYLDENNPTHRIYIFTNYNNLGATTSKLSNYADALLFYKKALLFADDSLNNLLCENNIAMSYQSLKEYDKALEIFDSILQGAKKIPAEYARILSNKARTSWLKDPAIDPRHNLLKALAIRKQENDFWGMNASFVHLTDYYINKKIDSALFYAKQMYSNSKVIKNVDDEIYALKKLVELSSESESKRYFKTYQHLTDSVQQARAAAKNQFALIRYEVEKNKADNLRLQKDNAEKANRLIQHRAMTGSIAFLFIITAAGGTFWYKKRKQRLALEAQNEIKANKLKTSRKIHDVVANGLYRVMAEIEYKEDMDRDGILDKLEDMYHKSREISYEAERSSLTEQQFNQQVGELLKSFSGDNRRILIVGNERELWENISENIKEEVIHMLQEFMVNMKKHSQSKNVIIRFEKDPRNLSIHYKDDGVGMPENTKYGNGLHSTGIRIKNMNGQINFASATGEGLKIEVIIPVS